MSPRPSPSQQPSAPTGAKSQPSISLVMPTIHWDEPFGRCARAALAGLGPEDEALVVFDGTPPEPPAWLLESGARLLSTGLRQGPAAARNLAAAAASGDVLLFVDADVELHTDAVDRIREQLRADPGLAALFGSYDDRPAAPGLVSRFRNLLHHHTHSSHPGPATTFWAGCGAVRREAFLALGGFDAAAYRRPCIEDIEFGLRLSAANGRIRLDPAIQGTHHKRWTLGSMLITDIRQRAIPWSRLLLTRRELPGTLNLHPAARLSAAACLALPGWGLVALALPGLRPWALLGAAACLAVLLLLNRPFHSLLLRRLGPIGATTGVGLHALYLAYSSLTFALVTLQQLGSRPVQEPHWLQGRPTLKRWLLAGGLSLLALLALAATIKGLLLGWRLGDTDLYERLDEWRLFQSGIYPSGRLATDAQRALPHFRTSVYLPWALPLFGLLFAWGGAVQGTLVIQGLSLLALALIAAIGWRTLRPWGMAAAGLGGLAPLAIAANSNALGQGQFSIVCMGLLSLGALLLRRQRTLPAGLCWALAMVKPQIAAVFVLPLLAHGQRRGLMAGLGLLGLLSAAALLQTHTAPLAYVRSWLAVLPHFIGEGNVNAAATLLKLWSGPARIALPVVGLLAAGLGLARIRPWLRRGDEGQARGRSNPLQQAWQSDPLLLAGVAAVTGAVGLYHRNLDNIMLFPALLAALRLVLLQRRTAELALALLTAASLWTPQRLLDLWPSSALAQSLIWTALGLRLLLALRHGARARPAPAD